MNQAINANWTNATVDYYFASKHDDDFKANPSAGLVIVLLILFFFIVFGIFAAVI